MKLTYVSSTSGDWCGIYLDNKIDSEGHSIAVWEWLHYIKLGRVTEVDEFEVDGEWLESIGNFPKLFEDIPKEQLA